jgi:AcrR family transcriptional regulator
MPKVTLEHRTARHDQIVSAARRCAMEQGFHKTTMADVIRESGLSAGAVYGYFKSKEEIVAAIAEDALGTVDELFENLLASEQPLTPLAALEATIEHVVKVAQSPPGDVTRVAVQAWAEALRNDSIREVAKGKYCQLRNHFVVIARRAQADGTLDPDVDPEHVAQVMFSMIPITPATYKAGLRALLRS